MKESIFMKRGKRNFILKWGEIMAIRYIFGRASRGKTYRVFEEIKRALHRKKDEKLILIVPEQFTLQAERDLIKYLQVPGIMKVEVLSFTRLAYNVFNEVGGITRIPIDEQGKSMMLRKIMEETQGELSVYGNVAKQQGFISKYIELLGELKKNNVHPEDIEEQIQSLEDGMMKEKLKDVFLIYKNFMEFAKIDYLDSEDAINLLIEKLDESHMYEDASIWVDGFSSFSAQTITLIGRLMVRAKGFTLSLPMDQDALARDREVFHLPRKIVAEISGMAKRQGIKEEIIDLNHLKGFGSKEINHLETEIYAFPYHQYKEEVENIEIFQGSNIYTEIEYMATKVVELVRERNYRWRDIAVVCNKIESYGSILKRTFEEYEIPYFLDQKRGIMNNPIIEFVLSTLETIMKGYSYGDVSRLLKTGFSPLAVEEYEILENYMIQYGIRGNKWKSPFRWGEEEKLEKINEIREKFMQPLLKLEKKLKGKQTFEKTTKDLYTYLEEVGVKEKLHSWIEQLRREGLYEYVNENTQIWNILMETFDQLVEILGEQEISLRNYHGILQSGFASFEIGIIPTTLDQVLVGQIQRSKSHDIKALFVVGVNDGVLPSGVEDKDILSNEEKLTLKEAGVDLGSDNEIRSQQERFLIYSALSKPKEFLWLSFALADGEGKALRPSTLIDGVKKIFPKLRQKGDLIKTEAGEKYLVSMGHSTLKHLIENLRLYADGQEIYDFWWEVYKWYYRQPQWREPLLNIVEGLFHKNQVSYVGEKQAKRIYTYPIHSSVSRLEGFVSCPFAHFIKYGLRPKERQEYKVEAPDIGELFHDAMAKFTDRLKEKDLNWRDVDRELSGEVMDGVIEEIVPEYGEGVFHSTHRYKYLVKRLKRISKRAIWTLTNHLKKGEFDLYGHELSFGKGGDFPPLEIELASGEKIFLEGRIDRIDVLEGEEEYIKIIDYKSGSKDFSLSDIYYGLSLQLMVYLDAVLQYQKNPKGKEFKPAGIFYFKIDDPMIQSEEKLVEKVEEQIAKKLKMKGLVLKDVNIVKAMDGDIKGQSSILPAGIGKGDSFYKSSSALEEEGFFKLLEHCRSLIKEISEEMLKGNIKIFPVKKDKLAACKYCSYGGICQFDPLLEDNKYNNIVKLKDEEVLEKIQGEGERNGEVDREPK